MQIITESKHRIEVGGVVNRHCKYCGVDTRCILILDHTDRKTRLLCKDCVKIVYGIKIAN